MLSSNRGHKTNLYLCDVQHTIVCANRIVIGIVGSGGSIENAAIFLANPHEAHQIAAELLVAINGIIGDCVIVSTELCSLITCLAHGGSYQV